MSQSPHVFDADAASFQSLVIDASHQRLVLVDFWAAWCAPCRALAPILEKLADTYAGRIVVVKVDTDREQELAGRFAVRSLPTVKLFVDGEIVDEFLGAHPESAVRALIDRYVSRESDHARVLAATLRAQGELDRARSVLEEAHVQDPENHRVTVDLANLLIDAGEFTRAREALQLVPAGDASTSGASIAGARLAFAEVAASAPPSGELEHTIDTHPGDCDARYALSARLAANGEYEPALEQLLELLRINRTYRDDAARKGILSIFELLGTDSPLIGRYRARMSSLLY